MRKKLFKKSLFAAVAILLLYGGVVLAIKLRSDSPAFSGFSLVESYQEDAITSAYQFNGAGKMIKLMAIPHIKKEEAQKMIDGKTLTIQALYGNAISPYPGMISNQVVCSQDMIPEKKQVKSGPLEITYFEASLTSRLTYGVCVETETTHKGFIAWTFCPEKSEYRQLELIYPKEKFDPSGLEFIKANICN